MELRLRAQKPLRGDYRLELTAPPTEDVRRSGVLGVPTASTRRLSAPLASFVSDCVATVGRFKGCRNRSPTSFHIRILPGGPDSCLGDVYLSNPSGSADFGSRAG